MNCRCENLIKWLDTFHMDDKISSVEEISNGVILSQILNLISPEFFTEDWTKTINAVTNNLSKTKVSNLKKIVIKIFEYYAEEIQLSTLEPKEPDVVLIAEKNDETEMGRFIQLILGCAVNCNKKHEYIQRIMGLEETIQHAVMTTIQELMEGNESNQPSINSLSSSYETGISDQNLKLLEELKNIQHEKDIYAQRCHELDQQVITLFEEKSLLKSENEKLNEKLNKSEIIDDSSTPVGRKIQQFQKQVEQLQDELFKSETVKDELKIKGELLEKDLLDVQKKNETLLAMMEDSRNLKDELDILRHNSDKVTKYENTISTLKKKLDDMIDLKNHLKMVEDKNTSLVEKNVELEEELKRSNLYKNQLDSLKRQVQDLHLTNAEEIKRSDRLNFELQRSQERISGLQKEKERLQEERNALKELNEEMKCSQINITGEATTGLNNSNDLEMLSLPPEIKEKILRLQYENKSLMSQVKSSEDMIGLNSQLEDAVTKKCELELEIRSQNHKIMELEAKLEDLLESKTNVKSKEEILFTNKIIQNNNNILKTEFAIPEYNELKKSVQELHEKLLQKENDMVVMEEKYKKYLEKAKQIIKQSNPRICSAQTASFSSSTITMPEDIHSLKIIITEKDSQIKQLENDLIESKNSRNQEDKLMMSAFNKLSGNLHRKSVDDRLGKGLAPQSFLAKQRKAHSYRPSNSTSVQCIAR